MWIKNENDIERFKNTINKCRHSVWIITNSGEEYNMKDEIGYYLGLASLLKSKGYDDPEVYAQTREDRDLLLSYLENTEPILKAS